MCPSTICLRRLIVDEHGVPPSNKTEEALNVAAHFCKLSDATNSTFAELIDSDRILQSELVPKHDEVPRHAEAVVGQFALSKKFSLVVLLAPALLLLSCIRSCHI